MAAAICLFLIFVLNVALGAFGGSTYLSDVGEMLVLLGASIAFVVVILRKEAAAKSDNENS